MTARRTTASGADMHDSVEELAALASAPALRAALESLGAELTKPFRVADNLAMAHQRSFRRITWWATTFGTISILLSIVGMVGHVLGAAQLGQQILIAQSVTLVITAAAVLRGLFAYRHENWLLERCRAEQLRALKFLYLLDPAIWSADERERQDWVQRLRLDVDRARTLRYEDIVAIAGKEDVPGLRDDVGRTPPDPAALEALATYYDRKRLSPQRDYFLRASMEQGHFGSRALPLFFFGAVFLEILQVVLTLIADAGTDSLATVGIWLSAAAIGLPAMWAGIRTQQGARESSRNATRSRARHGALTQLSERLLLARGNPVEVYWTMRLTEFVLQVDQREWLRLLREAEWYG